MSRLKVNFQDAIDVIKLIIALLPLIKEILSIIDSWSEDNKVAN